MRHVSIAEVFSDGQTARAVRDAIMALGLAAQWDLALQLTQAYGIRGSICLRCGLYFGSTSDRTYAVGPRGQALAMCLGCARGYNSCRL